MPAEPVIDALNDYLLARTPNEMRRALERHPQLLKLHGDIIDMMLRDPLIASRTRSGRSPTETEALLRRRKALLERCRQVGIPRAFAEISSQTATRQPGRSGWPAFWAISAIVVIAVVAFVVIKLHGGSSTPGGVTASAINEYQIEVSWTDGSKGVTGFNIDNGCPIGTCGGHGITLAKTVGPVTSTIFQVTPGTYQCFRVEAILKAGDSAWSSYGCASTPSFTVSGTQAWMRTDVILATGDRLYIEAAGLMSIGSSSQVGPGGNPPCTPAADDAATASAFPAPHLPCLSLIAEIGGGPPFEVGTSVVLITGRGRLYLGVNASSFSGSSGSWTVNMKIGGAPPSP